MSNWIPKEKLTAYQRWEVAAFDEQASEADAPQHKVPHPPAPPPEASPANGTLHHDPADADLQTEETVAADSVDTQEPAEPPLVLPTAADIERMHHDAHAEGYAAGYQEGIAAAQASAEAMATLMDNLQQAMSGIDQGVADQLLTLAMEVANQVLRQSLSVQPELLLAVVKEAVSTLHPHHGQPLLFVHPDDATLVRNHLGEQMPHINWRIVEDGTLTRGGCRVEVGASEVDATLETRWRRVVEGIGISEEWLAGKAPEGKANER
ncbi:MAG: flagellar assembly protein FliH [Candidatus Accumulibacter phosphatis]|jgi:flagellar assembly protein FliH|uniref:flagellar assembly protein FliH n=1 Tax=Candidatus Accumulibacter sp. ACC012 TaxID=2823332 RepID=UPI0025C49933|nr:flagellar assembly protein FliH [Candidatus Accumulibacter sp. ACC012]